MTKNVESLIVESDIGGTSERSFRATGAAEFWRSQGVETPTITESGTVFTRDELEQALRKVSRKVKK